MPEMKRPVFADKDFNIRDFGAQEGGKVKNTEAIAKAIETCNKAGGGRVVVPAGKWLTGKVHLKSNVNLHVVEGAELLFSDDPNDYLPAVHTTWEGFECYNYSPLVYAYECENIAITGKGKLTCIQGFWRKWMDRPPAHLEGLRQLYEMAVHNVPVEQRQMVRDNINLRPQFIQPNRCRNVLIEDVAIRESPFWTVHPVLCENLIIRGIDVRCRGRNTDGVDPEFCKNVLIEYCQFDQGDDPIVIKAGRNHDAWRIGKCSENIVIRFCTVILGHNLLAIGSEMSGGVRNVYMHDCDYRPYEGFVRSCVLIKTNHRRGGFVENIYVDNVKFAATKEAKAVLEIDTDVLYQWRDLVPTYERRLTKIKNIQVKNVTVEKAQFGIWINGEAEEPVEDIILENVKVNEISKKVREIKNAGNIKTINVQFGEQASGESVQIVQLRGDAGGKRFDGIGAVNGGGATSVLLKDYPEPQRSQIMDLVFKPKFGASVSALLAEIPGDGNSTQGSMPSHMRTRDDLNYRRGYIWWCLTEAKKRNNSLTLDGTAWSAPGWIGNGEFWSQDAADYYVKWLQGLRNVYGLELDAIGCRNEKRVSYSFAKQFRASLDANGFERVKLHAFDNWPDWKFDFVRDMLAGTDLRQAVDIVGAHVMYSKNAHASKEVQRMAEQMDKPIWNTEDHIYLKGFACEIGIVECFNDNFIHSGATKIINWYDIAGVYPMEPYSEDPAMILAHWPWSGHYEVREALWGYAHYGQFTEAGWTYLKNACGELMGGGSFITMKSPGNDYSIIIETKDAKGPQQLRFEIDAGLSGNDLCVWRSNAKEQFIQQESIKPVNGAFAVALDPESIYSLSTTRGQRKGSFENIPEPKPFPFPYYETFETYANPEQYGYLPHYLADIEEVFEITPRPDGSGMCIRQVCPIWPISWAPSWNPYTIIGDKQWNDYEVSADIWLNPGDTAAVMGRINHVGTGYGTIPKGYFLELNDSGKCNLVVVRGKQDKKKPVGDAEQQATIKAMNDDSEGGEKVLATVELPNVGPRQWHTLTLRFEDSVITGLIDGKKVMRVSDSLYSTGMAGLMARSRDKKNLSMPYYDNLLIKTVGADVPPPQGTPANCAPIYPADSPTKPVSILDDYADLRINLF